MMTFQQTINSVLDAGLRLDHEDGELLVYGDKSEVTPELLDGLRHHKATIIRFLGPNELPPDAVDDDPYHVAPDGAQNQK